MTPATWYEHARRAIARENRLPTYREVVEQGGTDRRLVIPHYDPQVIAKGGNLSAEERRLLEHRLDREFEQGGAGWPDSSLHQNGRIIK